MLALDIIREVVKSTGRNVGPIVALSYKNHAVDEFLVDALQNQKTLGRSGRLIRVRLGKPEDEELMSYTEKRSVHESTAQKELDNRLGVIRRAKELMRRWNTTVDINQNVAHGTCFKHPLCQGHDKDGQDYQMLANKNKIYCDFHEEEWIFSSSDKCCGRTKKNKGCKTPKPPECTGIALRT